MPAISTPTATASAISASPASVVRGTGNDSDGRRPGVTSHSGRRSMKRRILLPVLLAVAVAAGPSTAFAQSPREGVDRTEPPGPAPTGADMPTVGGNLANQHYSGLTQITKRNLSRLGPVWRTHGS